MCSEQVDLHASDKKKLDHQRIELSFSAGYPTIGDRSAINTTMLHYWYLASFLAVFAVLAVATK